MSSEPNPVDEVVEARVRRVPRYGLLMALGALVGVIVAAVLALIGGGEASIALGVTYPAAQVFGFLLLWTLPAGVALGGLVGLLMERLARRHERVVRVDHARIRAND